MNIICKVLLGSCCKSGRLEWSRPFQLCPCGSGISTWHVEIITIVNMISLVEISLGKGGDQVNTQRIYDRRAVLRVHGAMGEPCSQQPGHCTGASTCASPWQRRWVTDSPIPGFVLPAVHHGCSLSGRSRPKSAGRTGVGSTACKGR